MIRLARLERRRWQGNLTMETGALANEVYIKIFGGAKRDYLDRKHFYRLITKASRQVLINYAQSRAAKKRGGDVVHSDIEDAKGLSAPGVSESEILWVGESIERLRAVDERQAEVTELKVFADLSSKEIAIVLGTSKATVERDWKKAREWFATEFARDEPDP